MGTFRPSSFVSTVISKAMLLLAFALGSDDVFAQIAQRGSATTNTNSGTNISTLTIGKPSGVIAGDIIIANIVQNRFAQLLLLLDQSVFRLYHLLHLEFLRDLRVVDLLL